MSNSHRITYSHEDFINGTGEFSPEAAKARARETGQRIGESIAAKTEDAFFSAIETPSSTSGESRRDIILDATRDLVSSLLRDDRRDDEELGRGEIEAAIEAGEITAAEIARAFKDELEASL